MTRGTVTCTSTGGWSGGRHGTREGTGLCATTLPPPHPLTPPSLLMLHFFFNAWAAKSRTHAHLLCTIQISLITADVCWSIRDHCLCPPVSKLHSHSYAPIKDNKMTRVTINKYRNERIFAKRINHGAEHVGFLFIGWFVHLFIWDDHVAWFWVAHLTNPTLDWSDRPHDYHMDTNKAQMWKYINK